MASMSDPVPSSSDDEIVRDVTVPLSPLNCDGGGDSKAGQSLSCSVAGNSGSTSTDMDEGMRRLLERQKNERMFELRRIQLGERPVTGHDHIERLDEFFSRFQGESSTSSRSAPAEVPDRPEAVRVDICPPAPPLGALVHLPCSSAMSICHVHLPCSSAMFISYVHLLCPSAMFICCVGLNKFSCDRFYFNIGLILVLVNVAICLFCVVWLSWIRRVDSSQWEVQYPAAIPIATASFGLGAIFLMIGFWPLWSFLTPIILFVLFMGFIVLVAMIPPFGAPSQSNDSKQKNVKYSRAEKVN